MTSAVNLPSRAMKTHERWRLPRIWMFFGFLLEESWSAVRPLKSKCVCEVRKHQWGVQEFSGLWSQNPLIVRQRRPIKRLEFYLFRFKGSWWRSSSRRHWSGRIAFMTMSSAGLLHASRYKSLTHESVSNGEREAARKRNFRGDWNNGPQLLKGRAHFRLIR